MSTRASATFRIADPDSVPVSLTLTMRLSDWKAFREQLRHGGQRFPSWRVEKAITNLVARATERFEEEVEEG